MTTPAILTAPQILHIRDAALKENIYELGMHVIHLRRIPDYYLRRECIEQGADPAEAKNWTPSQWVTTGRVTIDQPQMLQIAFITFEAIHQRLSHHPTTETHQQARMRLNRTLKALAKQGIPRARIAAETKVNPKTIRSCMEYTHGQSTSNAHCPWDLLDRIGAVDWQQFAVVDPEQQGDPITDPEIRKRRNADRQHQATANQAEPHFVRRGDPCWQCYNPWPNMVIEPPDFPGRMPTVRCRVCSREAYLLPTKNRQ